MFRRDEIYVMHATHILQLDHPFRQLLGRQIKARRLMCNIMILTEHTPQVAPAEKHTARPIMALEAWFLAKVGCDGRYLYRGGADQAVAGGFVAVDVAQARAEVALAEVGIGGGAFEGGGGSGNELVARDIGVEKEGRGQVEGAFCAWGQGIEE